MPVSDDEKRRHIRIVFVRFSFRSALSVVAADTVDSAYYCLLLKVEAENDRCLRSVGVLVTTHLGNLLVILALRVFFDKVQWTLCTGAVFRMGISSLIREKYSWKEAENG